MRLLFLGDIVGEPGRKAVINMVPALKKEMSLDFVVANGENAAGGRGITPKIAIDLMRAGISVLTTGDHVWDQQDLIPWLAEEPRILRPLNYPQGIPGRGSVTIPSDFGPISVIQVQGRTFTQPPLENPFLAVEAEVARLKEQGSKIIFVDIHAETTSEKIAMGYFLDGKVSAIVGTHTHVQTADEVILEGGTAYLTDAGMCGPVKGVLGREVSSIVERFLTSMPRRFPVAKGPAALHGVIIDIDPETGRAVTIERFSRVEEQL